MNKAYGRLDIFWPEGRLETFVLRENSLLVGRDASNDLVIDYSGVDSTHIRIDRRPEGVVMTPLSPTLETFIDGVAAAAEKPVLLRGGEEIQLGSLRIVYRMVDDTATIPLMMPVEDTQRIESDSAPFRIELQLPQITVVPGSYISVELSVTNTGRDSERFSIDVAGVPAGWIRVNRPVLVVDGGDTSLVIINLRPIRHSDSRPGDYSVTVTVTPERTPQAALRALLAVRVQPFSGFGIALSNPRLANTGSFRLHLHNHGSAPVALRLTAVDRQSRLNLRLSQSFAQLGPGERVVVSGTANARDRRIFGSTVEYPFEIVAHADAPPQFTVAVPGRLVDRPPLPGWTRLAALAGVVLAVLLILYGVWGLVANRQITPTIAAFTANAAEVVRGQPISIAWDVRDATALSLSINGSEPEAVTELESGGRTFVSDDLPADVVLELVAINGEQRASSQVTLHIYTPVTIAALDVSPPLVFRNVVQTLTIMWSAEGYTGVPHLRGLDAVGQAAQIDLAADQAAIQVGPLLPMQDFTVRLVLTDERGVEVERTEDVTLTDPQCTSARPDVPLLVAPQENAAVLSVLAPGVARIVTGRTPGADFLAVRLDNGGEGWVKTADFVCPQELFRVEDLREILVIPVLQDATVTREPPPLTLVPTATPTATSTATLTATPTATMTASSTPTLTATPTRTPPPSPALTATANSG